MEEKAAAGTSHHGLSKGKLCLTNPIGCYRRTTGAVDVGRLWTSFTLTFTTPLPTIFIQFMLDLSGRGEVKMGKRVGVNEYLEASSKQGTAGDCTDTRPLLHLYRRPAGADESPPSNFVSDTILWWRADIIEGRAATRRGPQP